MITIYKSTGPGMITVPAPAEGSWVHAVAPTAEELAQVQALGVAPELLTHVLDPDERPRSERVDGTVLLVLRFPFAPGPDANPPFVTVPLTVLITATHIITLSPHPTGFLTRFAEGQVRGLSTAKHTRFVLLLFWHIANAYLDALRQINSAVDALEDRLERSLRNEEVLGLLKYQKSLVFFTTALRANEMVLERLQKGNLLPLYPEDSELAEDVLIEVRQAIEMTGIAESILSQMMDAFASIISNNLNVVMKVLTSVTIILSLPTLLASLYGMNVPLPGAGEPWAFFLVLGVGAALAVAVAVLFWRKDWL